MNPENIEKLNAAYAPLRPGERFKKIFEDFSKILITSSFGTTSAYSLSLLKETGTPFKVYFLDTGYHFPETLAYMNTLKLALNLDVHVLKAEAWKHQFTKEDRTWEKDPDYCCTLNKVEPLQKIKGDYEVWVSGLMRTQNNFRNKLPVFEFKSNILKFYPIIDISEEEALAYIKSKGIPAHPLLDAGYASVGCTHCTVKGKSRDGRWANISKSECGLHQ
jgi:phosphoadenosine phosphosulfate reductase